MLSILKAIDRNPGNAIRAMVDGLLAADADDTRGVTMTAYGRVNSDGVCFGCAATWSIAKITNAKFTDSNISTVEGRAMATNVPRADYDRFEYAMEQMRLGYPHQLCDYCNIKAEQANRLIQAIGHLPGLGDENWKDDLHHYLRAAEVFDKELANG